MEDCISCGSCFEMEWVSCYSYANFTAGLDADTNYFIWVTDRHGNTYTQGITTDSNGDFQLDLTLFDEGMFTANSGSYTITASMSALIDTEEVMTIGYEEFSCIKVFFLN